MSKWGAGEVALLLQLLVAKRQAAERDRQLAELRSEVKSLQGVVVRQGSWYRRSVAAYKGHATRRAACESS